MQPNPLRTRLGTGLRARASMAIATALIALSAVAALTGCDNENAELSKLKDSSVIQPFLSAEDFDNITADSTVLCMQGVIQVDFAAPGQLWGYKFDANEGDVVGAKTTGAPDIDTMLLLYGPADATGFYGEFPVLADDDSGVGLHSQVGPYTIKTGGAYILVLTTYGGASKGSVKLHISLNGQNGCSLGKPTPPNKPDPEPGLMVCCLLNGQPMSMPKKGCAEVGGKIVGEKQCLAQPPVIPVCCALPTAAGTVHYMSIPTEDCELKGGQKAPESKCESTPNDLVCCTWPGTDPAGPNGSALIPKDQCVAQGGAPAPKDICDGPPPPEECCALPTGEVKFLPTEMCFGIGGQPAPADVCQGPSDEPVCCLGANIDPAGGPAAFLPLEKCLAYGGQPAPPELCKPQDEPVCCVMKSASGQVKKDILPLTTCLNMGGEPAGLDMCGAEPQPPVCCAMPNTFMAPFVVPADACKEKGGQVVDWQLCEPQPTEPVCCQVWDAAGKAKFVFIPEIECKQLQGQFAPPAMCEPAVEVCCIFANTGTPSKVMLKTDCISNGGMVGPKEQCATVEADVCCLVASGLQGWEHATLPKSQCLEIGGLPSPKELCASEPFIVCCSVVTADGSLKNVKMGVEACQQAQGQEKPVPMCLPDSPVCCATPTPAGALVAQMVPSATKCQSSGGAIVDSFMCEKNELLVCCAWGGQVSPVPASMCQQIGGQATNTLMCL